MKSVHKTGIYWVFSAKHNLFILCLRTEARPQVDKMTQQHPSSFSLPQQEDLGKNSQVEPQLPLSLVASLYIFSVCQCVSIIFSHSLLFPLTGPTFHSADN